LIYGYARVSTVEQNLQRQIKQLKEFGCDKIYVEKESGATMDRRELTNLIDVLQEGDVIIITDLTRISRSTRDLFDLVDILKNKKALIKSLKDSWLDLSEDNPYNTFLFTVIAGVAQLERDLTKMRQREGIEIAKKNGLYKGRPKTYTERNPRLLHAIELKQQGKSYKEVEKLTGVSESTVYRAIRKIREQN
jgi:DNA invertase Pin-like site-specific DNA recombinase